MGRFGRRAFRAVISASIVAGIFLSLGPVAFAEAAASAASAKTPTSAEIEAAADAIIKDDMAKINAPGAVVLIVQDGNILFKKGYGVADLATNTPVDPDTTVFRIGSIAKTVTATAVMQLVEAGKLDLQKDVNQYLKEFKVPATYSQPVTTLNLLTHTAGFDERIVGMEAADYTQVRPLGEFLSTDLPPRVRPPGQVCQYSNHGIALAGYLVEEISGMSYDDYVVRNIFEPLGMADSYPRLTADALPNLAREYLWKGGKQVPLGLYDTNVYPAGGTCATAADVAKFMIAQLGDGSSGDGRILSPATLAEMQATHVTSRDGGMAYTFFESYYGGRRFLSHGGDTNGTHSQMLLDPEGKTGLFVATNGAGAIQLVSDVVTAFLTGLYPNAPSVPVKTGEPGPDGIAQRLAGAYRTTRYPRETFGRIMTLLQSPVSVAAMADGSLAVALPGYQGRFEPVGDLYYRNPEDGGYISFRLDDKGQGAYLVDQIPIQSFERVRWYDATLLHMGIIGLSGLTFVAVLAAALFKRRSAAGAASNRWGWWLARGMSLMNLLALGTFLIGLSSLPLMSYVALLTPPIVRVSLVLFAIAAVLAVGLAGYTVYALAKRRGGTLGRIGLAGVSLMALGFAWVMNYYNMVGPRF